MNVSVLVSTFLAATIEVIEMVAIVVAVGVTRSWRAASFDSAVRLEPSGFQRILDGRAR